MTKPQGLSVSVVTYAPDQDMLRRTLASLAGSARMARRDGGLGRLELLLVDNGPGEGDSARVRALAEEARALGEFDTVELISGHGNVGYGQGHNLAIQRARGELHLILNPDVEMAPDCLAQGLAYLQAHPGAVVASPAASWPDGSPQFLCKRYPTLLDLALRGFAPRPLRRLFAARLGRYEMRDTCGESHAAPVPIVSGCFMLARRPALAAVEGFSPAYFMYFEDFDLSLRLSRLGALCYVPAMRIVHHGGQTARKGWRHVSMFMRSARIFFGQHGWRLF